MKTRRQRLLLIGSFVLVAAFCLVGTHFYAPQPKSWTAVRAGTSRAQAHSIVGMPTTDSFELKALDRWQIRSLLTLRSLDVFYGYGTAQEGVAAMVVIHNNSKLVYPDDFAPPATGPRRSGVSLSLQSLAQK